MGFLAKTLAIASILLFSSIPSSIAQDSKKEATGSISGRVLVGGAPAARVTVVLRVSDRGQTQLVNKATTDEEGRFTLKSVAAGSYMISTHTPALVDGADISIAQPGHTVALSEGEEVDGIDFSLVKGGVITGRVTDAEGRPLIEQRVNLIRIDERGQNVGAAFFNPFMFNTDDRGVYRLFGLMPGRYKVSVGDAPDGTVRIGFGGGSYPRTFHPDVSDEGRATILELSAGGEAAGIDIKLGRASKTYAATGRIVDADTGKPLANVQFGHGALKDQQWISGIGWTGNRSNTNGDFRIDGLTPGRYAAFVVATEQVDFYSEPAVFDVTDSDVASIEIKTRRGSTISGNVVIEGSDDPDVLARLPKLELRAAVMTQELAAPSMAAIRINVDGSFLITGLRPGKARIMFSAFASPVGRGFTLIRVESEGVTVRDGVEVRAGENVSGVRVVLGYGMGIIRGQVKVEGGELPRNTRLGVLVRKLDSEMRKSAILDARGRFSIDSLMPGDYEVTVTEMRVIPSPPGFPPSPIVQDPNRRLAKQNVAVSNGVEANVILVVDVSAKEKDNEK